MSIASAAARTARSRVVFSGIQPTGVPHLGNYAGALRQWAQLQDTEPASTTFMYSIVDLHALTALRAPSELKRSRREMLAALLAVGINPERATLFYQSAVPEHSELMWILSCAAPMGYLSRMTQWKQKSKVSDDFDLSEDSPARLQQQQQQQQQLKLGLFSYPVLQAADVLVHRATHVPVGHDQAQHLEFARECASQFNKTFDSCLVEPETLISPTHRIKSLLDPTCKMSKSDPKEGSRILLTDSLDQIRRKIKSARTDSIAGPITYDPSLRPGVANLLDMLSIFDAEQRSPSKLAEAHGSSSLQQLKEAVIDSLNHGISSIRGEYARLLETGQSYLDEVEAKGMITARESASATMTLVRATLGIPGPGVAR